MLLSVSPLVITALALLPFLNVVSSPVYDVSTEVSLSCLRVFVSNDGFLKTKVESVRLSKFYLGISFLILNNLPYVMLD